MCWFEFRISHGGFFGIIVSMIQGSSIRSFGASVPSTNRSKVWAD
jgi:hypothetical protein